jgi:hypothetical protein
MAFGNVSPRRQASRSNNLFYLVVGIFLGFFASSFLSTLSVELPQENILRTPLHSKYGPSNQQSSLSSPGLISTAVEDDGWNAIHVFYGNTSHIAQASHISPQVFEKKQWFSQLRQDELVSRLLKGKRDGYFVDLASNDAVRISNTYALETRYGWKGLCLEANPVYWSGLAYRTRCKTIAAVVGREMMQQVHFRFPNRAAPQGGIVGKDFDNHESSRFGEDQLRFTVTLSHILERFQAPEVMDYLSLDVEGAEFFVMESFPFEKYRFQLLTVERPNEQLCHLLTENGYRLLKQLKQWGETIWMHESAENMLDMSALEMDIENYAYSEKI